MGGLFRGSDWRSFHLAISIHCVYVRMSGLGLAWLYTHCIVCAIDLVSYVVDLLCRYAVFFCIFHNNNPFWKRLYSA